MIRLLFLVRDLDYGGTQRQLVELVKRLDRNQFEIVVATFYSGGDLLPELAGREGIVLVSLAKQGRWDLLPFLTNLYRLGRHFKPQVVYGTQPVANEFAWLLGELLRARIIWSLRASSIDYAHHDWLAALFFRAGARLSAFPDLIEVNSWVGQRFYTEQGYSPNRLRVIPNGFDTDLYAPHQEAGQRVRREWGLGEEAVVIGMVARLDGIKDHPTFLRAAAHVVAQRPEIRFVCVGDGPEPYRRQLRELGESLGLASKLIWAGARADMPAVYNGLDLLVLATKSEGFPNVLGEALACGVPCIATDVGDCRKILDGLGETVPPQDPDALGEAILSVLSLTPGEQQRRGEAGRERVVREFSLQKLADSVTTALLELVGEHA